LVGYVPNKGGVTTWFNGDIYSTKLTGQQTGGQIGLVEATVPPGGGPPPDVHERTDETFYVVNGELEFLDGHRRFTASTGAVVFLPRGNVHRFYNPGIQLAKLGFIYTPCGAEGMFVEGGDKPEPGVQVQPWGPERIDERMNALLARYDTGLPPQQSINTRGLDGPRHSDRRRAGNTSQLNWR
jgi:mannose-6-phosphate isomerase-like protein (cupin superfamily)